MSERPTPETNELPDDPHRPIRIEFEKLLPRESTKSKVIADNYRYLNWREEKLWQAYLAHHSSTKGTTELERQRDELAEALRELNAACKQMRYHCGEDVNANTQCTKAQEKADALLARLDTEKETTDAG